MRQWLSSIHVDFMWYYKPRYLTSIHMRLKSKPTFIKNNVYTTNPTEQYRALPRMFHFALKPSDGEQALERSLGEHLWRQILLGGRSAEFAHRACSALLGVISGVEAGEGPSVCGIYYRSYYRKQLTGTTFSSFHFWLFQFKALQNAKIRFTS